MVYVLGRAAALSLLIAPFVHSAGAAGESLSIRLMTGVSSRTAKAGMPVLAILTRPLPARDAEAAPAGSRLEGVIAEARGVGLGFKRERARLAFQFDRLTLPSGETYRIEGSLESVDNAREAVDRLGRVRGIRATATMAERATIRLGGVRLGRPVVAFRSFVAGNPVAFAPLWTANLFIFGVVDPEIDYPPGTEMQIRLLKPWEHGVRGPAGAESPLSLEHAEDLVAQAAWTIDEKTQTRSDLINLAIVGDTAALTSALSAAGWNGTVERRRRTCFRAFRAVATHGAYRDGPMSTQLWNSRKADGEWQKSLNTFTKRHHFRMWESDLRHDGHAVWMLAATHDTGAVLRGSGFTHRVDPVIDREREKVVADLRLTGCVEGVRYLARPKLAGRGGDGRHTDGQLAVIRLNECREPRHAAPEWSDAPAPRGRGWLLLRRVTLNARNSLLRENHAYRAFDATRILVRWVKSR